MSPDIERRLLRAVCEAPADDLPRLALADLWEERGRPGDAARAEFVRVQLELARLLPEVAGHRHPAAWWEAGCADCARHDALSRRASELLDLHGMAWLPRPAGWGVWRDGVAVGRLGWTAPDPGGAPDAHVGAAFRRGFVASASLTAADFMRHAAALFAAAPLEEVRLTDRRPVLVGASLGWAWWRRGDVPPDPEGLPPALWSLLAGGERTGRGNWCRHGSEAGATAALSAAAVAFGRAAAGLPGCVKVGTPG